MIAEQCYARATLMLVHSLIPSKKWFADFVAFAALYAVQPFAREIVAISKFGVLPLSLQLVVSGRSKVPKH